MLFVEIFAPITEIFVYTYIIVAAIFGTLNIAFVILFSIMTWGMTILLSLFSLIMDQLVIKKIYGIKDIAKLVLFSLIEPLGYRQFTFLARVWGFFRYLIGKKYTIEKVKRKWPRETI